MAAEVREMKKIRGNMKTKQKFYSAAFLAPSLLCLSFFYIAPFFVVIYYSMVDNPISRKFVFLDNYKTVLGNGAFWEAVKNTLGFSGMAVPLTVILSLLLAVAFMENIPAKSQLRTIFLSPLMVPAASTILVWKIFFHLNGPVNEWLHVFNIQDIDWLKSGYSPMVLILLFLWKNTGYCMVIFMAALGSIPDDVPEAAKLEGAVSAEIFFRIKMRFLSPVLLFVTLLCLVNSFKVFREVYLLTGDYPYGKLYLLQHFMNNLFRDLDYQKISAASVFMFLFVALLVGILFAIEHCYGKDVEG